MNLQNYPDKVKPYAFHGLQLTNKGDKYTTQCPFCDKEDHFEVKSSTGKYRCYLCDENGNIYTFLRALHELSLDRYHAMIPEEGPYDSLDLLMEEKGVTIESAELWGITPSVLTSDLLLPSYNSEGTIVNLSKVVLSEDKWTCYSTPGCKKHCFGRNLVQGYRHLYIVEGPWDGMNLKRILVELGVEADVIALAGIHGFSDELLEAIPEEVTILFDNDYPRRLQGGRTIHPVKDAVESVVKKIREAKPETLINLIKWGTKTYHNRKLPDGYDVSDIINSEQDSKISYDFLNLYTKKTKMAKKKSRKRKPVNKSDVSPPWKTDGTEDVVRTKFKQICTDYESHVHFPGALRDSLAVLLATVISTELPGDPVWLRLIGPPGCGKTTLAEAIAICREYVMPISITTGFHSGYRDPGDDPEEDNSLLSRMHNMCTIIKDGDTLLSSKDQARILSEMRDFYDGTARAEYRNKVNREYNLRTTMVICGTDELRRLNRSSLGERFLDCEVMTDGTDDSAYVDKAMSNAFKRISAGLFTEEEDKKDSEDLTTEDMVYIKNVTASYLVHLKENMKNVTTPTITQKNQDRIKNIARFLALTRAKASKNREDDRTARPRAEVPTRLAGQFTKLAVCLAIVMNKKSIDLSVVRVLRKVAVDSAKSYELDIVHCLADHDEGLPVPDLEREILLGKTAVLNRLKSMYEFGIVVRQSVNNESGYRGRNRHVWKLSKNFKKIYDQALGS